MKNRSIINRASHYKKIQEAFDNQSLDLSKDERRAFMESLKAFESFGQEIYRSSRLKEISAEIGQLVETAQSVTLKETDGWFDNVTVSRHNKRLTEAYKIFEKCSQEVETLQQRMEAAYEDIAETFKKYYDV